MLVSHDHTHLCNGSVILYLYCSILSEILDIVMQKPQQPRPFGICVNAKTNIFQENKKGRVEKSTWKQKFASSSIVICQLPTIDIS